MKNVQMELERIETELGEYKEMLGDNFPLFVNYHLAARLIKAQSDIAFYKKRLFEKELVPR